MNSEPFVGRIETGAFRDRPALERAVELEPEVVMQTGRVVLLDQLAQLVCPRLADPSAFGLLSLREVALGMIALERRSFCGFGRHGITAARCPLPRRNSGRRRRLSWRSRHVGPRSFSVGGRVAERFREIARSAAPGNGGHVVGHSRCDYRATLVAGPRSDVD
jgi:hypothetical protein